MSPAKKAGLTSWQAKRLRVIALLKEPGADKLSNCEVGRRACVSEYLVRRVKKNWLEEAKEKARRGKLFVPTDQPRSGRPPKYSARCVFFYLSLLHCFLSFIRYKRSILSLARKHPFWTAKRLIQFVHNRSVANLQFANPGTHWMVCIVLVCFPFILPFPSYPTKPIVNLWVFGSRRQEFILAGLLRSPYCQRQ